MITNAIKSIIGGKHLSEAEMIDVFNMIMEGGATQAQIGSFLTALRMKGETEEEITGAAKVMRTKAAKVDADGDEIDTCGTGGDASGTFNISTAAAIIAAGAGLKIAKHGNRAASSKCGSADVLEALGVKVDSAPEVVSKCMRDAGIGFMFAPRMHAAMKHAIGARREIGIRTVFNVLGPLTNPAGAKKQLLGVFSRDLTELLARVLSRLGSERAMLVHGSDGLDEITLTGPTYVSELKNGKVENYMIHPQDFGLKTCRAEDLVGGDAKCNAEIISDILNGKRGSKRDAAVLNAAAALTVSGKAANISQGIESANKSIDSGSARIALEKLIAITNGI